MASYANLLGTWYPSTPWVKHGGAWVEPQMGYRRISGIWTPLWELVPVDMIVGLTGAGAVPTGWTEVSGTVGNKMIVGAGGTYAHNTSGGSNTLSMAGVTVADGEHPGSTVYGTQPTGLGHTTPEPAHTHTWSVSGTFVHNTETLRLIKAVDATMQRLPANAVVLHQGTPALHAMTEFPTAARFLVGHTTAGTVVAESAPAVTIGAAGAHSGGAGSGGDWDESWWGYIAAGAGAHVHGAAACSWDIQRFNLVPWYETAEFQMATGIITMFDGTVAPYGWNICDGTNDTPDLRDRFIRLVASTNGSLDTPLGANTVSVDQTLGSAGTHRHEGASTGGEHGSGGGGHNYAGAHTHPITGSGTVQQPEYHALTFIKRAI